MRQADYDLVAARLNHCGQMLQRNAAATRTVQYVGRQMADVFEVDNPAFDRDRFLIGAGIPRHEHRRARRRD